MSVQALRKDNEAPANEATRTVAGNFEVVVNLTDRRQFKMTGFVYSDDDRAAINARVDHFQDVVDRQCIRVDIITKEAQISGHTANLQALKEGYLALVAHRDGGKKLTSQQKLQMDGFSVTEQKIIEQVASLQAAIDEGKRKLAAP